MNIRFPVIDLPATGENIVRLRKERGLSVRDIQAFFGFEEPRAIYKWQRGESLPTVDNLLALGALFGVSMEEILVPVKQECGSRKTEQRASARCSIFSGRLFGMRQVSRNASANFPLRSRRTLRRKRRKATGCNSRCCFALASPQNPAESGTEDEKANV